MRRYMAVGTVDEAGHPWVTPVWFASEDYRHFHWVSSPDAKHSRYLAARPEVAIAIFDSSVPVGGAQAVYMKGVAEELTGPELERGLEVFDRVSRKDIDMDPRRRPGAGALPALSRDGLGPLGADPGQGSGPRLGRGPQRAHHALGAGAPWTRTRSSSGCWGA